MGSTITARAQEAATQWEALIAEGLGAAEAQDRLRLSRRWLQRWVRPLVSVSRCERCGREFDPNGETGTLFRCWRPDCAPRAGSGRLAPFSRFPVARGMPGHAADPGGRSAADYAQEWEELVQLGLTGQEIIARSEPNGAWFYWHVRPLVTVSRCDACGRRYRVSERGSLVRCEECLRKAAPG